MVKIGVILKELEWGALLHPLGLAAMILRHAGDCHKLSKQWPQSAAALLTQHLHQSRSTWLQVHDIRSFSWQMHFFPT